MEELNCKTYFSLEPNVINFIDIISRAGKWFAYIVQLAELYSFRKEETHYTLESRIVKFGKNIDLQPKLCIQHKKSDY